MASGPCVPHQQVEHTAAPTKSAHRRKKTLAKGEPSTHGDVLPERVEQGNGWRDPNQPFRRALGVDLFGYRDRVVHFDTEVPHGALQLGVTERPRVIKLHFLRH